MNILRVFTVLSICGGVYGIGYIFSDIFVGAIIMIGCFAFAQLTNTLDVGLKSLNSKVSKLEKQNTKLMAQLTEVKVQIAG